MMNSGFLKCKTSGNAESYLRLLPDVMHGPPEKCYFTEADVTEFPGIVANTLEMGKQFLSHGRLVHNTPGKEIMDKGQYFWQQ